MRSTNSTRISSRRPTIGAPTLLQHQAVNDGDEKRHAICGETGEALRKDRKSVAFFPKPPETREWLRRALMKRFVGSHLDETALDAVINACRVCHAESDTTLIQQGDEVGTHDPGMYILEQGELSAYKCEGDETPPGPCVSKYSKRGDVIGELAVLYSAPRAATVIVNSPSLLWSVDRGCFLKAQREAAERHVSHYTNMVRNIPLLRVLSEEDCAKVVDALRPVNFAADDIIIEQGDTGQGAESFYLLLEGKAVCEKDGEKVMEYKENSFFGELALLRDQPRAARVYAATACKCATLDRASFMRLVGPLESLQRHATNAYGHSQNNEVDEVDEAPPPRRKSIAHLSTRQASTRQVSRHQESVSLSSKNSSMRCDDAPPARSHQSRQSQRRERSIGGSPGSRHGYLEEVVGGSPGSRHGYLETSVGGSPGSHHGYLEEQASEVMVDGSWSVVPIPEAHGKPWKSAAESRTAEETLSNSHRSMRSKQDTSSDSEAESPKPSHFRGEDQPIKNQSKPMQPRKGWPHPRVTSYTAVYDPTTHQSHRSQHTQRAIQEPPSSPQVFSPSARHGRQAHAEEPQRDDGSVDSGTEVQVDGKWMKTKDYEAAPRQQRSSWRSDKHSQVHQGSQHPREESPGSRHESRNSLSPNEHSQSNRVGPLNGRQSLMSESSPVPRGLHEHSDSDHSLQGVGRRYHEEMLQQQQQSNGSPDRRQETSTFKAVEAKEEADTEIWVDGVWKPRHIHDAQLRQQKSQNRQAPGQRANEERPSSRHSSRRSLPANEFSPSSVGQETKSDGRKENTSRASDKQLVSRRSEHGAKCMTQPSDEQWVLLGMKDEQVVIDRILPTMPSPIKLSAGLKVGDKLISINRACMRNADKASVEQFWLQEAESCSELELAFE